MLIFRWRIQGLIVLYRSASAEQEIQDGDREAAPH